MRHAIPSRPSPTRVTQSDSMSAPSARRNKWPKRRPSTVPSAATIASRSRRSSARSEIVSSSSATLNLSPRDRAAIGATTRRRSVAWRVEPLRPERECPPRSGAEVADPPRCPTATRPQGLLGRRQRVARRAFSKYPVPAAVVVCPIGGLNAAANDQAVLASLRLSGRARFRGGSLPRSTQKRQDGALNFVLGQFRLLARNEKKLIFGPGRRHRRGHA